MKQLFLTLILVVCSAFCSQNIFSYNIPEKGSWGDEDVRSIIPAPPTASIEGKVLTINLSDPLSNLMVQVKDKDGKVVYENRISTRTPQSYSVTLNVEKGEYTLNFIHRYGFLYGDFVIE